MNANKQIRNQQMRYRGIDVVLNDNLTYKIKGSTTNSYPSLFEIKKYIDFMIDSGKKFIDNINIKSKIN